MMYNFQDQVVEQNIQILVLGNYRIISFDGETSFIYEEMNFQKMCDGLRYGRWKSIKVKHIPIPVPISCLRELSVPMLESFMKNGGWERLRKVESFL